MMTPRITVKNVISTRMFPEYIRTVHVVAKGNCQQKFKPSHKMELPTNSNSRPYWMQKVNFQIFFSFDVFKAFPKFSVIGTTSMNESQRLWV